MPKSKKFEEILGEMASMGPGLNATFGAVSDILTLLRKTAKDPTEPAQLTGDPVADAALLRALGVEKTIKDRWNIDLGDAVHFIEFLTNAFTGIAPFFGANSAGNGAVATATASSDDADNEPEDSSSDGE